ncbi:MAG: hypothetical protein K2G11_01170 [Muribaculaceae bacterium]|nr:hypothetical protein [Muribaculaceae bacterium]
MKNLYTKDTLKHYLHNPLGILGMFITFCYLIASIVFSVGLGQLKGNSEKLPFIDFINAFVLDEFTEKRHQEIMDFYSSVAPDMTVFVFDFNKLKVEFSTES